MSGRKRGIRLKIIPLDDEGLKELLESASERLVGKGKEELKTDSREGLHLPADELSNRSTAPPPALPDHSSVALRYMIDELSAISRLLGASRTQDESAAEAG